LGDGLSYHRGHDIRRRIPPPSALREVQGQKHQNTYEKETVLRTQVLIIDEHDAVRQALETRLRAAKDIQVIGCTGCWQEGVYLSVEHAPDVVLLETKRSDGQGLAALRRLRAECPRTRIIILTSYPDSEERRKAMDAGAIRYLLKEIDSSYLVQEIRIAALPRAPI